MMADDKQEPVADLVGRLRRGPMAYMSDSGPVYFGPNADAAEAADTITAKEAEIAGLRAERDELSDYAFEATKAITNLTAGGSEYFAGKLPDGRYKADLPFCVQRIRDRFETEAKWHRKAVARAITAESEATRLRTGIQKLIDGDFADQSLERVRDRLKALLEEADG